jgi:hypothetical protein
VPVTMLMELNAIIARWRWRPRGRHWHPLEEDA